MLVPRYIWEKISCLKRQLSGTIINRLLLSLPKMDQLKIKAGIISLERMDYSGKEIFLEVNSDIEYKTRIHSCNKEKEIIGWIENKVAKGAVLYDIGANVGAYSLVAGIINKGKVKVYAFEPAYFNYYKLVINIKINNLQDWIIPLPMAVSDDLGISDLNFSSTEFGSALHILDTDLNVEGKINDNSFKLPVLTVRLDDLVTTFGLPAPNFLKIDVDGTELEVLKGGTQILSAPDLQGIYIELDENNNNFREILEILAVNNFFIQEKYPIPWSEQTPRANTYNYIFYK